MKPTLKPIQKKRAQNSDASRRHASERQKHVWNERRLESLRAINNTRPQNSVRVLRLKIGMSQTEFADGIGMKSGRNEISAIENGKRPSKKIMASIEEFAASRKIEWQYK